MKALKTQGIKAFLRGLATSLLKKLPTSKSDAIRWQTPPHSIVPRSFSVLLLAICVILSEVMMYDDLPRVCAASDVNITVTMDADIPLTFNGTLGAFTGSQLLSESCDNERAHRIINVTLPDEYEMNTPEGIKPAPEGTELIYSGQMSARRGYHNSQATDPYSSTIKVKIPLTEDFKEYGPGEYSLIIPVELIMEEAYGSYTDSFSFTPWDTLVERGIFKVEGGTLTDLLGSADAMEIDPSVSELKYNFAYTASYREVDIPKTVTSANEAFEGSSIRELYFEGNTIPEGICKNMTSLVKNNQTFFVVIDRANTLNNVYMLSLIDEDDLQQFLSEDDEITQIDDISDLAALEEEQTEPEQTDQSKGSGGMLYIFLIITGAGVLIGYYYIRIYKPRKEEQEADSEDMEGTGSDEEYDDDVDYGDTADEEQDYSDY